MRPHRATSKAAHESVKEHKSVMYAKIKIGLEQLRVGGTFEEIAKVSGLKPDQTWKRLPEMVTAGTVFNTGLTRTTSSGRKAMVRQLVGLKPVDLSNPKTSSQQKDAKLLKQLTMYGG
jgi:hypothetical protein